MSAYINSAHLNGATVPERLLQTVRDRLLTNPGTRPARMDYGAGLSGYIDEELADVVNQMRIQVFGVLNEDFNISVSRINITRGDAPRTISITVEGVSPLAAGQFRVTL